MSVESLTPADRLQVATEDGCFYVQATQPDDGLAPHVSRSVGPSSHWYARKSEEARIYVTKREELLRARLRAERPQARRSSGRKPCVRSRGASRRHRPVV